MEMAVTYKKCVHEKIRSRLHSENACYNLFNVFSHLLSKIARLRYRVTYFCLWFSMISHTKEKPLLEGIWAKNGRSSWRLQKTA
jgi:hypothetical protein